MSCRLGGSYKDVVCSWTRDGFPQSVLLVETTMSHEVTTNEPRQAAVSEATAVGLAVLLSAQGP